jgi:16S rRNA U1498 N3-methylase RsmE
VIRKVIRWILTIVVYGANAWVIIDSFLKGKGLETIIFYLCNLGVAAICWFIGVQIDKNQKKKNQKLVDNLITDKETLQ